MSRPAIVLDDWQREMARHALGLREDREDPGRGTFRNRYIAGGTSIAPWRRMVAAGAAEELGAEPSGSVWFRLTREGAEAALRPGERLNPEDFPVEVAA